MATAQDIFNRLALGQKVKVYAPDMASRKVLYKQLHNLKTAFNQNMSVLEMDDAMIKGSVSVMALENGEALVSIVQDSGTKKTWAIITDDAGAP